MNPTPHSILVTGAAGFIAFHLVKELLERQIPVVGIDNFDPFYDRVLKADNLAELTAIAQRLNVPFSFVEKDICDVESSFLPKARFASIIHLAGRPGIRPSLTYPVEYLQTNVMGTLKLLEFARVRQIDRFLFGSTSSVYGQDTPVPFSEASPATHPLSPYAASKRAAEIYCSTYASLYPLRVAALRFFTVYGPRQRPDLAICKFSRRIMSRETIQLFGDGTSLRDYTFVSDIVDGILAADRWLARQELPVWNVFNLGRGQAVGLRELVSQLEDTLGIRARIEYCIFQPGEAFRTLADISKAQREFDYSPKVSLGEGIGRFVEWLRQSRSAPNLNPRQPTTELADARTNSS